jgi:hypothetical protein
LRDDQVIDDFHVLAFPNLIFNTHSEMHTLFRARPGCGSGQELVRLLFVPSPPIDHRRQRVRRRPREGSARSCGLPRGQPHHRSARPRPRRHRPGARGLLSAGISEVSFADFECRLTAMHTELDRTCSRSRARTAQSESGAGPSGPESGEPCSSR